MRRSSAHGLAGLEIADAGAGEKRRRAAQRRHSGKRKRLRIIGAIGMHLQFGIVLGDGQPRTAQMLGAKCRSGM